MVIPIHGDLWKFSDIWLEKVYVFLYDVIEGKIILNFLDEKGIQFIIHAGKDIFMQTIRIRYENVNIQRVNKRNDGNAASQALQKGIRIDFRETGADKECMFRIQFRHL